VIRRPHPLERVRAANPLPIPVEPDWELVKEHVANASRAEADSPTESPGAPRASLPAGLNRPATAPGEWSRRNRRRVLGSLVLCAALATGIWIAVGPGGDSPGFLARAASALTPRPDTVLYESWEQTVAPADRSNPESAIIKTVAPDQLWIEGESPRHYRVVLPPRIDAAKLGIGVGGMFGVDSILSGEQGRTPVQVREHIRPSNRIGRLEQALERLALKGQPLEQGGTLGASMPEPGSRGVPRTLTYVPPDELWSAPFFLSFGAPLPGPHAEVDETVADPVGELRTAIAEGRAHGVGAVKIQGRTLERIAFDPPAAGTPTDLVDPRYVYSHTYAYVEPETLHPVEIDLNGMYYRILAYEYLPATTANLALTNTQAQHPHATIVKADAATR
jgi:hypothetical protein